MTPHTPLSDFFITLPGLPSHTEVLESIRPVRSHRKPMNHDVWIVPCLMVGSFLSVAAGAALVLLGLR